MVWNRAGPSTERSKQKPYSGWKPRFTKQKTTKAKTSQDMVKIMSKITHEEAKETFSLSDEQSTVFDAITSSVATQQSFIDDYSRFVKSQGEDILPSELETQKWLTKNNMGHVTTKSMVVYGQAGTGKSQLIKALSSMYHRHSMSITATTGAAAVLIGGVTIHSVLSLKTMEDDVLDRVSKDQETKDRIQSLRLLIIDEISMLSAETIDLIVSLLTKFGPIPGVSCGGIVLVLVGDLLQLPPVITEQTESRWRFLHPDKEDDPMPCYIFESEFFLNPHTTPRVFFLTRNFRQNDKGFQELLSRLRLGTLTDQDRQAIYNRLLDSQERLVVSTPIPKSIENETDAAPKIVNKPTWLYVKCNDVEDHNARELAKLDGQMVSYARRLMLDPGVSAKHPMVVFALKNTNFPVILDLKVNAQVILLHNLDTSHGLCNGTRGVVKELTDKEVTVTFENGVTEVVSPVSREIYDVDGTILGYYSQHPFCLGYAITIHKSQGMTMSSAVVTLDKLFGGGMAYVAISRVSSLEGLFIRAPNFEKFVADERVVEYLENLKAITD